MAKYDVSREGMESLEMLAGSLSGAMDEIEENCDALYSYITLLEKELGIYYKEIALLVRKVIQTVEDAREGEDGIDSLVEVRIPRMIKMMESYIRMYLSGDDDTPKSKRLRM